MALAVQQLSLYMPTLLWWNLEFHKLWPTSILEKNVFNFGDFVQNFKMDRSSIIERPTLFNSGKSWGQLIWISLKFMILTVAVLKLLWNNLKCIIIRIRRILIIYMLSQYLKTVGLLWSPLFYQYKMAKLVLQRKTRRRKQAVSDWSFLLNRL